MQNDLAEIFNRLAALKAKAEALTEERDRFLEHLAEAETQIDGARQQLEASRKRLRQGKRNGNRR